MWIQLIENKREKNGASHTENGCAGWVIDSDN